MGQERSLWGWGRAERFPAREVRVGMGAQLEALLGGGGGPPDVRDPEPPRIPAPRLVCDLPFASAEPEDRALHARGRSFPDIVLGFRGDFETAPDAVLRPSSEAEVANALDWASAAGVAVVPFGGGTSVCGGVTCDGAGHRGVVSLDLARLGGVLEVDPISRTARIGAGALGPALEAALADHGLTLRCYPQSFEFSTLGGWIATRAGGHFATRYTHVDDLVQSVRMVTPTGLWASRSVPASGAGPSPDRWVLGSEGALGVITEASMRLQRRPRYRSKATVSFATFAEGVAACRAIVQSGLTPSNCRLLDEREARLHAVTGDGRAVLMLAFESAHHPVDALLALALEAATDSVDPRHPPVVRGPHHTDAERATGDREGERWRAAFFEAPYLQTALISLGAVVDTFETACTWSAFDALHADLVRSVKAALGRPSLVSCRFTHVYPDGPAPYYTFVAPSTHEAQLDRWRLAKQAAGDALMRHQATITHHHAVGRAHRPWYDQQRPEPFARALAAAKRAVDPAWILNPGVLVGRP
jgi:alkyldihydroxyacetonephosphate synthase